MESIILFLDFSLSFIAEYWSHLDKDVEHDEVGLGVVQDGLHHRAVVLKKIMIMQSMLTSWCLDYLAFKVNSDLFIILKSKIFQNDPKERLKCELIFLTLENNNLRIHCHPSIKSDMGQQIANLAMLFHFKPGRGCSWTASVDSIHYSGRSWGKTFFSLSFFFKNNKTIYRSCILQNRDMFKMLFLNYCLVYSPL